MSKVKEIENRFRQGYTMSLYGTRELLYEQMEDDISSLLTLFNAQKRAIKLNGEAFRELLHQRINYIKKNYDSPEKEIRIKEVNLILLHISTENLNYITKTI